jgi:uncharacterized protein YbjT (DUF2867 family)
MTRAILLGATGLVGSELLAALLADPACAEVVCLGRRPSGKTAAKLVEHQVDFAATPLEPLLAGGTALYSALGTTIKKAGSQDAMHEIDVAIPRRVAKAAATSGVTRYGLVSAVGANARSSVFYNRIKGELEEAVQTLGFARVAIARPSFLVGERAEHRPLEGVGIAAFGLLGWVPGLRKYRPIHARTVARALLRATNEAGDPVRILEPADLFALGGEP